MPGFAPARCLEKWECGGLSAAWNDARVRPVRLPMRGAADSLKVHIRRLREKIEATPSQPKLILTKAGVGYFLARPE